MVVMNECSIFQRTSRLSRPAWIFMQHKDHNKSDLFSFISNWLCALKQLGLVKWNTAHSLQSKIRNTAKQNIRNQGHSLFQVGLSIFLTFLKKSQFMIIKTEDHYQLPPQCQGFPLWLLLECDLVLKHSYSTFGIWESSSFCSVF